MIKPGKTIKIAGLEIFGLHSPETGSMKPPLQRTDALEFPGPEDAGPP
jgi:hypothetical protein